MAKYWINILGVMLFCSAVSAQHRPIFDYDKLVIDLTDAIRKGEKRALRDLGTILDLPEYREKCIQLLSENTLFLPSELVIDANLNREKFLAFYYEYEHELKFSDIAHLFFISPMSAHNVKFELAPFENLEKFDVSTKIRKLSDQLMEALNKNNYSAAITKIVAIGDLKTPEAFDWLIELISNKAVTKAKQGAKEGISQAIFSQLAKDSRLKALEAMLMLLDREYISPTRANKYITQLTNIRYDGGFENNGLYNYFNHLVDSLGTLEDLRHYGYKKYFELDLDFFDHPVDYYGQILARTGDFPWIERNAILDLVKIGHPRALLYLSGNILKDRLKDPEDVEKKEELIYTSVENITQIKVGVKNSTGEISFDRPESDLEFKRNYFLYWASHFEDYIWEDNQGIFINKNETAEKVQSYEKLFRRLSSKKDSIAFAAFKELCKGDPVQISDLADKYRQLLRNYNPTLPSFQYNFLESMTQLTQYCKKNNIEYEATGELKSMLEMLRGNIKPYERLNLEDRILNSLSLKHVTILEYMACLYEPNKDFNFSIGRIVDRFYSYSWDEILNDEQELRHYLKKSYLFENIGIIGHSNSYLRKFDLNDPAITTKLRNMLQVEGDGEIANQITQLIDSNEEDSGYTVEDFIADPLSFGPRDIKLLPPPEAKESQQLAAMIHENDEIDALKKIFFYLRFNANHEMVPSLFSNIDDERVLAMREGKQITVGDALVPIFENIYNFEFPEDEEKSTDQRIAWKELWQKDSLHYKNWGITFLENELIALEALDTVSIAAVNDITGSSFYDPILKARCLKLLGKVHPVRDIKKFEIEPALSVSDDLKYFRGFRFNYKVLDDIANLFEVENPEEMLNYLIHQSQDYSVENLGSFYNKLFQFGWFQRFINGSKSNPELAKRIARSLSEYLDQSDFITEFEEQNTNLHIAQLENIGKPLADRLAASVLNDLDAGSKFKIQQELISGIPYEEIGTIINYIDQLAQEPGADPLAFLRRDFGLPIFEIKDSKSMIKDHKNLSELEFYLKYLTEFGVDIMDGKNLDLQKIFEILEFDIVSPFVGTGGQKRDQYVYGVIKVLELTYNTTLDFHEKLNENQTFYTFTATKRAKAWRDYLMQNGLIKRDTARAPSFNLLPEAMAN